MWQEHRAFSTASSSSATSGHTGGFKIEVCVQAAQSPDTNVQDLGFFSSLKSDQRALPGASNLFELKAVVLEAYEAYDAERLERTWRCLTIALRGILEAGGGNGYATHRGDRARATAGLEEDRVVSQELFDRACTKRDRLAGEVGLEFDELDDSSESGASSSESDDGV